MDKVYFKTDSYDITQPSFPTLDGLYQFLHTYRDIAIEVGGHTNSNCDHTYCDQLSEARAKSVVDYLIKKGIDTNRLTYKGYGKRKPVASNETLDGRRRNQRVEVTVIELGVK
jgi:outer membrane protein OmpA-like peptidoglycan-associated protein